MKHYLHKITLLLALAIIAFPAFAEKVEYKGLFYNLDAESKTASLTYSGETPENNSYNGEISIPTKFKYNNEYYRITSIGEKAFYGCEGISYVKIGGLVTSIASQAFANNSMTSLIIPAEVTEIAEDAFSGSNIDLFFPEGNGNTSFLKGLGTSVKIFTTEVDKVKAAWNGTVKDITPHYYIEDLSTMYEARFRLHKTEYYSLPDAPYFEFSSVITHGVEIFPDGDGVYSWDGLSLGQNCEFQINYSLDYEDIGKAEMLKARPSITSENLSVNSTELTLNIVASEDENYSPTEKGIKLILCNNAEVNVKYAADATGKVTISDLEEDADYVAVLYAKYKSTEYTGETITFSTKTSTGIANTAEAEAKVTLNNLSKEGYIEVATTVSGDASYFIMNITGQKEKEGTIAGDNRINTIATTDLSSGIYLLNVNGSGISKTMKFIIK